MHPSIQCLSVYVVPCDPAIWHDEFNAYYSSLDLSAESAAWRTRMVPIVLLDVVVSGVDSRFSVGDFRQMMEMAPEEAAQVAYDEALGFGRWGINHGTRVGMRRQHRERPHLLLFYTTMIPTSPSTGPTEHSSARHPNRCRNGWQVLCRTERYEAHGPAPHQALINPGHP